MDVIYSSSRILIRQYIPAEEELFYHFFDDPEVTRYIPNLSVEEYKKLFAKTFEDYAIGDLGRWGVFDPNTGENIGNCLLRVLAEDSTAFEIGYSIARKFWGKGIASEIASALIDYAFSHFTTGDLTALTHPENMASQNVLLKAGFVRDGNLVSLGQDLYLFRLARHEK
jgi:ribosomal-protein-alanine N-acetyltransferase